MKRKITFLTLLLSMLLICFGTFAKADNGASVTISTNSSEMYGMYADMRIDIQPDGIESPVYEIYRNDTLVCTTTDDFAVVALESGKNSVYVTEISAGCISNTITANCEPYDIKAKLFERDYSEGSASDGMYAFKENSGTAQLGTIDETHGQSLIIKWDGSGTAPNLAFANASKYSGIFAWSADYYMGNVNEQNIFTVKTDKNAWLIGAGISADGVLRYRNAKNAWQNTDITVSQGQWLHIKAIVDMNSRTYTLYADGTAAAADIPFTADGTKIQYMSLGIKAPSQGDESFIAIDNVKQYILSGRYTVNAEYGDTDGNIYDENSVPYLNTRITLNFSEDMDEASISAIKLTDTSDTAVECDTVYYADSRSAVITPKAALSPDRRYSISIDGVLSADLKNPSESTVAFKTDKPPLCIMSGVIADGKELSGMKDGEAFTVDVKIQNSNNDETDAYIFTGIYEENKLVSIKSAKTALNTTVYSFEMTAPENADKCRIEIYLMRKNFEILDKITSYEN